MATELHTPLFQYKAEDNDTAYYYYVTVSDSFNNESGVSTPAFFLSLRNNKIATI